MRKVVAILLFLPIVPAAAQQPAERAQQSITQGTEARTKRDFSSAEKDYLSALNNSSTGSEVTYRSLFFLGLNKQEEANQAALKGDAAAASTLRDQAAAFYQRALEVKSTSTATILNLALLDIDRGKNEEAVALLERGLELAKESKSPTMAKFAEKLGDLQTADAAKAIEYYGMAASDGKPSAVLMGKITKSLLAHARTHPELQPDVIEYGWNLFADGDLDDALDIALSAIDANPPFSAANAAEMLTLVTTALARKNYDGATFAGSDTNRRLQAMQQHIPETLKPRVQSLFALYQGDIKDGNALSVWRGEWDSRRPYGRPASAQAIQQVARGLGYAAQRRQDFAGAERYYRLALDVDPAHPDAGTLRDLATMYYTQNRLPDVEQLLKQFESSIYEAKGVAYDRVEWEQVADLHRTLGTMYSWLHRDADAKTQFEREFEAVKQENEKRKESNRTDLLQIDATVRLQYADTLAALNERDHATSERLAAAETCATAGKIACVRDAVAHIDRADLKSPDDLARFQKYLDSAVVLQQSGRPLDNASSLKSQLAIISSDPNPNVRKLAEDALRKYGVTSVALENGHGTFQLGDQVMAFDLPTAPAKK